MKQARRWLLFAAALTLLPHAAYAQKKKPKGNTPAPAPASADTGTTAAPADADAPAAGAAPAGGTPAAPADADATAAPGGAAGATPAAGADTGGGMDICQITPDAPQCAAAKEINFSAEAKKAVHAEVYAVQQQYVIKAQRFEIMPYWEFTLNDQFVSHPGPGLALNYYLTQVIAVGIDGVWYGGLNGEADFNLQNRRAARIAVPLNDYQFSGDVNFTYVPLYGKFAGFGDFIFNYDAYILGGVGVIQTEPVAVIDPDNRKFSWNTNVDFDFGIGFRIFFTRWLAADLEVRDLIYQETLESLQIAQNPLDQSKWTDSNHPITNDVQLQVGLSLFLPTSFEYKLPK